MKKHPCASCLIAACLLFAACSPKTATLQSLPLSPVADGKSNEWTNFQMKDGLDYAVANDAQNLYLCVRTSDRANTLKIMRNGLQIWLDPGGGRLQTQGIRFPVPSVDAATGLEMRRDQHPDVQALHNRFRSSKKYLSASDFSGMPGTPTSDYAAFGLGAVADWDDQNLLTLEFTIPFQRLGWQLPVVKPIGIGLVLEGLSAPGRSRSMDDDQESEPSSGGNFHEGGGMRSGDGGMRGGHGGQGGGDYEKMLAGFTVWTKARLNSQ